MHSCLTSLPARGSRYHCRGDGLQCQRKSSQTEDLFSILTFQLSPHAELPGPEPVLSVLAVPREPTGGALEQTSRPLPSSSPTLPGSESWLREGDPRAGAGRLPPGVPQLQREPRVRATAGLGWGSQPCEAAWPRRGWRRESGRGGWRSAGESHLAPRGQSRPPRVLRELPSTRPPRLAASLPVGCARPRLELSANEKEPGERRTETSREFPPPGGRQGAFPTGGRVAWRGAVTRLTLSGPGEQPEPEPPSR